MEDAKEVLKRFRARKTAAGLKQLNVWISSSLIDELRNVAKDNGKTLATLVGEVLAEYLKRCKKLE